MTDWSTMKVLVTGGSQGIGLGIAEGFGQAGAAVAISARSAATLQSAAQRLREKGHHVEAIVADVSDRESCTRTAAEAERALGGLHSAAPSRHSHRYRFCGTIFRQRGVFVRNRTDTRGRRRPDPPRTARRFVIRVLGRVSV